MSVPKATRYWHCLPSIEAKTRLPEEVTHGLIYTSVLDAGILEKLVLDLSDWFEVAEDGILNSATAQSRIVFMPQTRRDDTGQLDVAATKVPTRGFCFKEILAGFVAVAGVPGETGG
jgi:hypothetical protein